MGEVNEENKNNNIVAVYSPDENNKDKVVVIKPVNSGIFQLGTTLLNKAASNIGNMFSTNKLSNS